MAEQTRPDLDPLLEPNSVAVVGASPDSWYSSQLIDNLLEYGFDGELYLVNPGRDEAWGRTCYDSLSDVPSVVDLAVVSVPRQYVVETLRDAGEMGVPAALVITAGFREADEEGARLEEELAATAREYDLRVCGPNCIGLANTHDGVVLTSTCSREPESGSIGLVSHSGALAFTTFFERAADEDISFSHVVSTGNEADQTLTDFVEYMAGDERVDAVCAYIEGVDDAETFVRVADETVRSGTPVLAVKVGRSEVAERATISHTGSVTGNDAVWDAAFEQVGVERVSDVPDLLHRSKVHARFDPPASPNVCIASTSGGLASLLADLASERGLELPPFSDEAESALLGMDELLTFGEVGNPADIRGYGADALPEIAEVLFADDSFDAYVFAIGLSAVDERAESIADDLIAVAEAAEKPVLYLWTGRKRSEGDEDGPLAYERVRREAPLFYDPESCIDALASLVRLGEYRESAAARPSRAELVGGRDRGTVELSADGVLAWESATDVLSEYGVDPVETVLATDAAEAVSAADDLGYPVVLKVDSPDLPHRTDVGAVRVGLEGPSSVRDAYEDVLSRARDHDPEAAVEGVLVQPMVADGVEAIVGVTDDEMFGPVVTVGPGGTLVELLEDRSTLIPPFSAADARGAVERTALGDLLGGHRGEAAKDVDELVELLVRVGDLAFDADGAIAELDLNPVFVGEDGVSVVDVLLATE